MPSGLIEIGFGFFAGLSVGLMLCLAIGWWMFRIFRHYTTDDTLETTIQDMLTDEDPTQNGEGGASKAGEKDDEDWWKGQ